MAQVAHRPEVEDRRPPLLADEGGELARDAEHLGRVASVRRVVAELGSGAERRLHPARRGRDADADAVVLAHEEHREREALICAQRRRVEGRLRACVVERRVAERADDHRVRLPRARDAEPDRAVDRERHPDSTRKLRGDGRRDREHGELLAAEDLVPPARDRLGRRGDDAEEDVAEAGDPCAVGARQVEGAGAVVEERGIVVAQRERDGRVRLVTGRADRVEAPPVLLQPARHVVGLPAVDLRPPDVLHLGRSGAERRARLQRPQAVEEMLLERVGLGGHRSRIGAVRLRPAAPARRSTRPRPRARSSARGGRRSAARPRRSQPLHSTPGAPTAAVRGRTRRRAATDRRPG